MILCEDCQGCGYRCGASLESVSFVSLASNASQPINPPSPHLPTAHTQLQLADAQISFPNPLFSVNKYLSEMWPPTDISVMLDEVSFTDHTQRLHLNLRDLGSKRQTLMQV